MIKAPKEAVRTPKQLKHHHHNNHHSPFSPKSLLYFLSTCAVLFILFQIHSLEIPPKPATWSFTEQWQKITLNNATATASTVENCSCLGDKVHAVEAAEKLRRAVTFLPLKDLRYASTALQGHTWFMSSMHDEHEEGEVQYQRFPSASSDGRLLCLKGRDGHDGSRNSYALAWPDTLPHNATLAKGLTFVSYNHYNYDNIWHGLSAVVPFVAWHQKNRCSSSPDRWVLYHWGELRLKMGLWLRTLMEATFDGPPMIEGFDDGVGDETTPFCFEKAVVMRHNEGGMSRVRREEVYGLMRCRARVYCNVPKVRAKNGTVPEIGLTLFMRTGPRSFKNESAVIGIFGKECAKVEGCRLMVARSNNLSFCEQVKLMSSTDILVSPHGAQLTNMFLMDRNSSVLEFFPRGWLKLAGVGQYVYHWIASWSGMRHQGAWRDPDGDACPHPEDDRRCMSIFKSGRIGYNESYFSEWARKVLAEVKMGKMEDYASTKGFLDAGSSDCSCS
ncbi:Transmembrane protein [Trema orientale]|uniref:Transmembrane protein n=1 Tax=Trema orientale TaxID=63057 RepID=A0A2P5EP99_TREOI|nr:Transmembrane protein [Trema orientale]